MIAPKQKEVLRVLELITEEKNYRFDRLLSAVDVVSQKEVVFLRRVASVIEYFE